MQLNYLTTSNEREETNVRTWRNLANCHVTAVDIGVNPLRLVISRAAMQQIVRFTFWSVLPHGFRGVRLADRRAEIGNTDLCLAVFKFDRDAGLPLFAEMK